MKTILLILSLGIFGHVAPYQAQICGNLTVSYSELPNAIELIHKEGCQQAITYQISDTDDRVLVYGVKVVAPY